MTITLEQYEAELRSWEGTRYVDGAMEKQKGADCLRFVVAMADWLHGYSSEQLPAIPRLPRQTSLHDEGNAWGMVRWLQQRYPNRVVWSLDDANRGIEPDVCPGDIICVKNQVHPGHALIAGTRKNEFWHTFNSRSMSARGHVHTTNLHWCGCAGMVRVWRLTESLLCT